MMLIIHFTAYTRICIFHLLGCRAPN